MSIETLTNPTMLKPPTGACVALVGVLSESGAVLNIVAAPSPLVSVIIPHLNEPEDLRRCLESLVSQRASGVVFEIIVVDNGSREMPEEVCRAFPGVRLERELTPGPGPARSRGARVAQGAILAFIDSDCLAGDGWLQGIATFFDRNPETDVLGGDIRIARTKPDEATALEAYEDIFSYRARLFIERDHYAATGNMAVRSEVFRVVGPFGGIGTYEDMVWGQKATKMGFRIAYVPEVRVSTPACRSFAELAQRMDRLVAHSYRDMTRRSGGRTRWGIRIVAMAVSPLAEIGRIVSSDCVSGLRERVLAFGCLTRIRLHRARRMLALLNGADAYGMVAKWNRE